MIDLRIDDLRTAFGLGVAGNFTGHLEQAGEHVDFAGIAAASVDAPKGIFPFYAPGAASFLGTFPLSSHRTAKPPPAGGEPVNLQLEPEVGLACTVTYAGQAAVGLEPFALGALNDCSVRRPGASKISHKKNWGADSKGIAERAFPVRDLAADGPTASYRLASFLRRDGATEAYGEDSALPSYSFYGERLLDWLVERLNHQEGLAETPLEDVGALLAAAGRPRVALVGIGATRYTEFGERTYLQARDETLVVVYDGAHTTPEEVAERVAAGREADLEHASLLRQLVYDAAPSLG